MLTTHTTTTHRREDPTLAEMNPQHITRTEAATILWHYLPQIPANITAGATYDQARRVLSAILSADLDEADFDRAAEYAEQLTQVRDNGDLNTVFGPGHGMTHLVAIDYLEDMLSMSVDLLTQKVHP